jgi:hypothetical protein
MALFDFALVKTTAATVAKNIVDRREKADALRTQLMALHAAPAARSEVNAAIEAWVDNQAKEFGHGFGGTLFEFASSPDLLRIADRHLTSALRLLPEQKSADDTIERRFNRLLCGLFGPQIKQVLTARVNATKLDGPSAADRASEAARLNAQITTLNNEVEQLRREAQEAGLKLPG